MKGMKMRRLTAKGSIRENIIVIALIVLAMATATVLISCGGTDEGKEGGKNGKSSTESETVIETNEEGETIVYELDKDGKVAESKKAESETTKKANSGSAAATTAAATKATSATQATQAQNICYVTVEGYCSGKAVTLQGGDTAYSVLKATGATVSAEDSAYGLYVKGINGRFASGASGWKYSLNGWEPNYGASSCSVKAGDTVKWYWGSAY